MSAEDQQAELAKLLNYYKTEKDALLPQTWKKKYERIYHIFRNEDEVFPIMREIKNLLLLLIKAENYVEIFASQNIHKFFMEDFFFHIVKYLIDQKCFSNSDQQDLSDYILQLIMQLFLKTFDENNVKMAEAMCLLFNSNKSYFKQNSQAQPGYNVMNDWIPSQEHLNWVNNLEVDQEIDVIKIDNKLKKQCWSRGIVKEIKETATSKYLQIQSQLEKNSYTNTRWISHNSWEMAPLGTKCIDWDWRLGLKVGDLVDACDTQSIWYQATILEGSKEQDEGKELYIGYRIYDEYGDKTDYNGQMYSGWSQKFDEWLSASSPRIAKLGQFSKKLFITYNYNGEDTIDDSNDNVLVDDNQIFYAVIRQSFCKSLFMLNLVNEFGRNGGYNKIFNKIEDKSNWCSVELVSAYMGMIGGVYGMIHRNFAFEYIPKLKNAVWENLLQSPDQNIRNFSKERLDTIYDSFGDLLKRIYSIQQKREILDDLKFDIALKCFNSEFLDKKLMGIKSLQDYMRSSKFQQNIYTITQQQIVERLDKANVFQNLYSSQNYHLIQRSGEFLKIIINEELLSIQNLELIWSGTEKNDLEQKLAIYKVITDVSTSFKQDHVNYFINKITSMDSSQIIKDDIELIHELTRFTISQDTQNFSQISSDFFWKLICESQKVSPEIVDVAIKKFSDIMKNYEMKPHRQIVLENCAKNIEQEVSVLSSQKIIQKIVDDLQTFPSAIDMFSQGVALEHLYKNFNIVELAIKNLKNFKQNIKQQLNKQNDINEQQLDVFTKNRFSYVDNLQQRVDFLNFIYGKLPKEIELKIEIINDIWDELVKYALIPKEKDIVYKWFQRISNQGSQLAIKIEDLVQFFSERMCDVTDLQTMTEEGFNCFKSVFCIINEKQQNLKKVKQDNNQPTKYMGQNMQNGNYRVSYSYDNNSSANLDFEYYVTIHPESMNGAQQLWNLIQNNQQDQVVEAALDFQNTLYNNFKEDVKDREQEFRNDYLKKSYSLLQQAVNNNLSEQNQLKCIKVLCSILDESEKKGNGGLKSLTSLIKGEMITLQFSNEGFYGSNIYKKFTLKVYTNSTVFELHVQVAKQLKTTWDEVKLIINKGQNEIKPKENGKSIAEIRLKNGQNLSIYKRDISPVQKAELLLSDGTMNPKAKNIFIQWFKLYSKDGKMTPDDVGAFISSCTGDTCKGEDSRVKTVFQKWDTDNDGILDEQNFLDFYMSACKEREGIVWTNLQAHHYRKDLKRYDEVEVEQIEVTSLPRYILSINQEFYQLAFSLLSKKGLIANETWKLVSRLPISPAIYERIVSLQDIRGSQNPNWNSILTTDSLFTLLYSLHVIEYLMEDQQQATDDKMILEETSSQLETENSAKKEQNFSPSKPEYKLDENPLITEYKKSWRKDFIQMGGFDHLYKIFVDLTQQNLLKLDIFNKNVLSFILKIFENYLVAAFATQNEFIYSSVERIKLFHIPLQMITKNINEEEDQLEGLDQQKEFLRKDSYDISLTKNYSTLKVKEFTKVKQSEDFIQLVEGLRNEGLAQRIMSKFEFTSFFNMLFNLAYDFLTDINEFESEDRIILEYTLVMMGAIMIHDQKYFKMLINQQNSTKLIEQGLLCSKSQNVRRTFNHLLLVLCSESLRQENVEPIEKVLKILIQMIPSDKNDNNANCTQYFELVCALINIAFHHKFIIEQHSNFIDFEQLLQKIIISLKDHKSNEQKTSSQNDKILIGLLNLCDEILSVRMDLKQQIGRKDSFNLVQEIFSRCLFDINNSEDIDDNMDINEYDRQFVKCKSEESRKAAYRLLYTLCANCSQNLQILIEAGFSPLMSKIPATSSNNYRPGYDQKSSYGYVGLRNLGCICYMNAMLQQFFMTPTFRYAILMADDEKEQDLVQKDSKNIIDDNVLHQFQKMFGALEQSDRLDYNPHDFCFSFKVGGEPVNVSIQQDAQEFLNRIFDKLENGIKSTPFRHILEGIYGGKVCSQLVCSQCNNVRSTIENFYNLSLEVKYLKSIDESFQKFITGEVIQDYFCEKCEKKVDINKRVCLKELPNVLIIHLQRIIFDLDLLQNVKVNSKLEFPMELDLERFTLEGLEWREAVDKKEDGYEKLKPYQKKPKQYYEYKLVGVVVHTGTSEYGHYFSFIDSQRDDEQIKKYFDPETEMWYEFNDSNIRDFKTKSIESQSFGGSSANEGGDDMFGWFKRDNSQNAYMLVYERRVKDPLKLVFENEKQLQNIMNKVKIPYDLATQLLKPEPEPPLPENDKLQKPKEPTQDLLTLQIPYYNFKRYIPTKIFKQVWEDNQQFMFEKNLYNEEFFKFIKDTTCSISLPELNDQNCSKGYYELYDQITEETKFTYRRLIDLLQKIVFDLLVKAYDNAKNQLMYTLLEKLRNLLILCPDYAYEFLDSFAFQGTSKILDTLIGHSDKDPRNVASTILSTCINLVIMFEGFEMNIFKLNDTKSKFDSQEDQLDQKQQEKLEKEYKLIQFLYYSISLIPTEVAKNWLRFQQYFEFWQTFSNSGPAQTLFLYQSDFVSILADFFLQKQSPINLQTERKHSIGNRYTSPSFDPLIDTIFNLVKKSQPKEPHKLPPFLIYQKEFYYILSSKAKKCLFCYEFWNKCFQEGYNIISVGKMVEFLAFENEFFSEIISIVILKNLQRCHYDDARTLLECCIYVLHINDSLTQKRHEWILGVPVLYKQVYAGKMGHYGAYGIQTLDDQIITFTSPLCQDQICTLLEKIISNRKRLDNLAAICLKYLLKLCEISEITRNYILYLPAPTYLYAKFSDFMRPFAENYLAEARKFQYWSFPKEETAKEVLDLLQEYEIQINIKIDQYKDWSNDFYTNIIGKPYETDIDVLKGLFRPYMIGQTLKQTSISKRSQTIEEAPQNNNLYKIDQNLELQEFELTAFVQESLPTGNFNKCLPQEYFKDLYILSMSIDQNSESTCFLQRGSVNYYDNKISDTNWLWEDEEVIEINAEDNKIEGQEKIEVESEDKMEIDFLQEQKIDTDSGIKNFLNKILEPIAKKQKYPHQYNSCIRQFVFSNNSHENLFVKLTFKFNLKQNELYNIPIVQSPICVMIKPNSQIIAHSFYKIVPELDWPSYEYDFTHEVIKINKYLQWPICFQTELTEEELELGVHKYEN